MGESGDGGVHSMSLSRGVAQAELGAMVLGGVSDGGAEPYLSLVSNLPVTRRRV
jgi:hypothetical protein